MTSPVPNTSDQRPKTKKNILFVNNLNENCGVFQYGRRTFDILRKSENYNFTYLGVSNKSDFYIQAGSVFPDAIIFNYHPSTLPWVDNDFILSIKAYVKSYGIHHEGEIPSFFDYNILSDSTAPSNIFNFSVPRPLFEDIKTIDYGEPQFPIIGSFGFGFYNKGFERLVKMVSDEFEKSTIRLNIPFAHYGDADGSMAKDISQKCYRLIDERRTNLSITHNFMKDSVLLNFLASNTINCFLYDRMSGRGLSSAIDYALSVDVPVAISDSEMFRHISSPFISTGNNSLKQIISRGTEPLKVYKENWSNKNFIAKYEYILGSTL